MLRQLGYTNLTHFGPGIEGWIRSGGPVESDPPTESSIPSARVPGQSRTQRGLVRLLQLPPSRLLWLWLSMVGGFAIVYWIWGFTGLPGLMANGRPLPADLEGLLASLYFSFVTATSVGFGDVVPTGVMRAVAVVEAATELLVFGVLVSRLIGQHQDQMIREIHQVSFEDRLGRVRVNLHLVLTELQDLAERCGGNALDPTRFRSRWDSLTLVLIGELRIVHELLYKTEQHVDEPVLETLLLNLAACLNEMREILRCNRLAADNLEAPRQNLKTLAMLSEEVCGECVPRQYAPELKATMDQIQSIGRELAG